MRIPKISLLLLCLIPGWFSTFAQVEDPDPITLDYYLYNEGPFDPNIPTPESFLGYQIGEWHIGHDLLVAYMRQLAAVSDRITITEYARSYEERPLIYLTITSEKNHAQLKTIREQHHALTDADQSTDLDIEQMPAVLYQGHSIHGNEPSGGNAAPLIAYWLAASKSPEVQQILNEVIILLDPCYNPDGFNRFASWVNTHKSKTLVSDPQSREFTEAYPRGRTNHYWFDLNRDWLPTQHPESQGRIKTFHAWKPNVLTDHHEMGTNSTFFFQPGVPQRTHPLTPNENQELTTAIAKFHAAELDAIGSLYYAREGFDDFYYGKGSTYPDVNGGVGILFEQASSRGHLQESVHGPLSFPYTIRNQARTAISTIQATKSLRKELLNYQRKFYQNAAKESRNYNTSAFVFKEPRDPERLVQFLDLLSRHQISAYKIGEDITLNGETYQAGDAYIVPTNQQQFRLIRSIFEPMTTFKDSLFYDVSAWTMPYAFNLSYGAVSKNQFSKTLIGAVYTLENNIPEGPYPDQSSYAYIFEWDHYLAPTLLYALQEKGIRTKVCTQAITTDDNQQFARGSILIPVQRQDIDASTLYQNIREAISKTGVPVKALSTGWTNEGIDIGSRSILSLKQPKVLMLIGNGVNSYEAGEIWHLLDQRYQMQLSMAEENQVSRLDLSKYNVLILPEGSHYQLNKSAASKIKEWVKQGGTLVAIKGGARWASNNEISYVSYVKIKQNQKKNSDHMKCFQMTEVHRLLAVLSSRLHWILATPLPMVMPEVVFPYSGAERIFSKFPIIHMPHPWFMRKHLY